jgi:excisionase family DNA binding protein
MSEEYLTVTEVARIIKVRPAFIRAEIKRGSLPAIQFMGKRGTMIRRSILDAYMRKQETGVLRMASV